MTYLTRFGLRVQSRDSKPGAMTSVPCKFCFRFRREAQSKSLHMEREAPCGRSSISAAHGELKNFYSACGCSSQSSGKSTRLPTRRRTRNSSTFPAMTVRTPTSSMLTQTLMKVCFLGEEKYCEPDHRGPILSSPDM